MYARVTRLEVPPEKMDADIALTAEIAHEVENTPGGIGVLYMVDRETCATVAVSLWDSEQAMRDSEELATRVAQKRVTESSARVLDLGRYEVVARPAHLVAKTTQRSREIWREPYRHGPPRRRRGTSTADLCSSAVRGLNRSARRRATPQGPSGVRPHAGCPAPRTTRRDWRAVRSRARRRGHQDRRTRER